MPRTGAGHRYPHASSTARQHDHQWCPVTGTVAELAVNGTEPWGTEHDLPPVPSLDQATRIRQGLFRGRDCVKLKDKYGELSVSVTYRGDDGELSNQPVTRDGKHVLVVRVWSRDIAKREITRRVKEGEPLHYNVMRGSI